MPRTKKLRDKKLLDEQFLTEINFCLRSALMKREEAENIKDMIENRTLKKKAKKLIEDYDTGVL